MSDLGPRTTTGRQPRRGDRVRVTAGPRAGSSGTVRTVETDRTGIRYGVELDGGLRFRHYDLDELAQATCQ